MYVTVYAEGSGWVVLVNSIRYGDVTIRVDSEEAAERLAVDLTCRIMREFN